jgi:histidinol-phosphate aminotransferase
VPTASLDDVLARLPVRDDLRGQVPYGAPQLDVAVRLNTNENSYPLPAEVVDAVVAAVAAEAVGLNRYPDREFIALRQDLARYLTPAAGPDGIRPEQLWAGNGSNEVLQHVL